MWKHLHGDWNQIPGKGTNTTPTGWLQTPAKLNTLPDPTIASFAVRATVITTVSELTFFSASRERRSRAGKRGDIGYYISSRIIIIVVHLYIY
jgi:hypothetical protein